MTSARWTVADGGAPPHDDVRELFGALGVRLLNGWDQRRIGRIGAVLYLVAGASVLQFYVTAAESTASPSAYLLSGLFSTAFGGAVLLFANTASDAGIVRLYPVSTLVLLFGAAVAIPTVLYFVGIQGRGHAGSAVYVLPLILGFYLLTRWLAALLLATIAVGHAVLLTVSGDIAAPVSQYLFLLAILASAGLLIGGLVDRLDQSVRAEERSRAALVRSNETLEARVAQQAEQLADATATRLEEVRASRARLVEGSDATRRQVERDLHDGAQQRLVTVALRLRTLHDDVKAAAADTDSHQICAQLDEISGELQVGLRELRDLARGVYLDRGDLVAIGVTDDGRGGADPRGGGLSGLADRVEAMGGNFAVTSVVGRGTRVAVELPGSARENDAGQPSCDGPSAVSTMSG